MPPGLAPSQTPDVSSNASPTAPDWLDAEQQALRELVHVELEIGEVYTCSHPRAEDVQPHELSSLTLVATNISDQTLWVTHDSMVSTRTWHAGVPTAEPRFEILRCGLSLSRVPFEPGATLRREFVRPEVRRYEFRSRASGEIVVDPELTSAFATHAPQPGGLAQFGMKVTSLPPGPMDDFGFNGYDTVWCPPVPAELGAETPRVKTYWVD